MMILETVLSDIYVCQISCFSPQVKYLGEFVTLAATLLRVMMYSVFENELIERKLDNDI
jgi:hypothetical protein